MEAGLPSLILGYLQVQVRSQCFLAKAASRYSLYCVKPGLVQGTELVTGFPGEVDSSWSGSHQTGDPAELKPQGQSGVCPLLVHKACRGRSDNGLVCASDPPFL
jgi:hypothetical protein